MKTITLNDEQVELLSELLSLDMDKIGFDDDEQEILNEISDKLKI
ncbi:MAG TPA: hypothetical protein PKG93_05105 [Bacilli bacterium]|nr:hypothetical protein [Bacilli bacterium]